MGSLVKKQKVEKAGSRKRTENLGKNEGEANKANVTVKDCTSPKRTGSVGKRNEDEKVPNRVDAEHDEQDQDTRTWQRSRQAVLRELTRDRLCTKPAQIITRSFNTSNARTRTEQRGRGGVIFSRSSSLYPSRSTRRKKAVVSSTSESGTGKCMEKGEGGDEGKVKKEDSQEKEVHDRGITYGKRKVCVFSSSFMGRGVATRPSKTEDGEGEEEKDRGRHERTAPSVESRRRRTAEEMSEAARHHRSLTTVTSYAGNLQQKTRGPSEEREKDEEKCRTQEAATQTLRGAKEEGQDAKEEGENTGGNSCSADCTENVPARDESTHQRSPSSVYQCAIGTGPILGHPQSRHEDIEESSSQSEDGQEEGEEELQKDAEGESESNEEAHAATGKVTIGTERRLRCCQLCCRHYADIFRKSFLKARENLSETSHPRDEFLERGLKRVLSQRDVCRLPRLAFEHECIAREQGRGSLCNKLDIAPPQLNSSHFFEGEGRDSSSRTYGNAVSMSRLFCRDSREKASVRGKTLSPMLLPPSSASSLSSLEVSVSLPVEGEGRTGSRHSGTEECTDRRRRTRSVENLSSAAPAVLSGAHRPLCAVMKEEVQEVEDGCLRPDDSGRRRRYEGGGEDLHTSSPERARCDGSIYSTAMITSGSSHEPAYEGRQESSGGRCRHRGNVGEKGTNGDTSAWGLSSWLVQRVRELGLERTPLTPCDLHNMCLEEGVACIIELWLKPWLKAFDDSCCILKTEESSRRKGETDGKHSEKERRGRRQGERRLSEDEQKKNKKQGREREEIERKRGRISVNSGEDGTERPTGEEDQRNTTKEQKSGSGEEDEARSSMRNSEGRQQGVASSITSHASGEAAQGLGEGVILDGEECQAVVDLAACRRSSSSCLTKRIRARRRGTPQDYGVVSEAQKGRKGKAGKSVEDTTGDANSDGFSCSCQVCDGYMLSKQGVLTGDEERQDDDGHGRVSRREGAGACTHGVHAPSLLRKDRHSATPPPRLDPEAADGIGISPTQRIHVTGVCSRTDSKDRLREKTGKITCRPRINSCCHLPWGEAVKHCVYDKTPRRNFPEGRKSCSLPSSQEEDEVTGCVSSKRRCSDRPSLPSQVMFLNAYQLVQYFGDTEKGAMVLRALYADTLEFWLRKHVQRIFRFLGGLSSSPRIGDQSTPHQEGTSNRHVIPCHHNKNTPLYTNCPDLSRVSKPYDSHKDVTLAQNPSAHTHSPDGSSTFSSSFSSLSLSNSSERYSSRRAVFLSPSLPGIESASSSSDRRPSNLLAHEFCQSRSPQARTSPSSASQPTGCFCCSHPSSASLYTSSQSTPCLSSHRHRFPSCGSTPDGHSFSRTYSSSGLSSTESSSYYSSSLQTTPPGPVERPCTDGSSSLFRRMPLLQSSSPNRAGTSVTSSHSPCASSSLSSGLPVSSHSSSSKSSGSRDVAPLTISSQMSFRGQAVMENNDSALTSSHAPPCSRGTKSKGFSSDGSLSGEMVQKSSSKIEQRSAKPLQDEGAIDTLRMKVGRDIRFASSFLQCFVDLWQAYGGLVHSLLRCMSCLDVLSPIPKAGGRNLIQTALHIFEATVST